MKKILLIGLCISMMILMSGIVSGETEYISHTNSNNAAWNGVIGADKDEHGQSFKLVTDQLEYIITNISVQSFSPAIVGTIARILFLMSLIFIIIYLFMKVKP